MDTEIRKKALALYRAPFTYDGHGYIWDADGHMVADDASLNHLEGPAAVRVRGWGRISYEQDPGALQDCVGTLIAEALTEYWKAHRE